MTFSDKGIMQTDLYKYITDDLKELYVNNADCKLIQKKEKRDKNISAVYYADCESDTMTNDIHRAYCISYIERNGSKPQCIF